MIRNYYILFLSIFVLLIFNNCQQEIKQDEFVPYSYKYSIEELQKEFSNDMMAEARMDMDELYEVMQPVNTKPVSNHWINIKSLSGFWMQSLLFFMIGDHILSPGMVSRNGIVPGILIGIWHTCTGRILIIIAQHGVKTFREMISFHCSLPGILMPQKL